MAIISIVGILKEKDTNKPMSGFNIEIYGSATGEGNQQFWMGGGTSKTTGQFSIYLREDAPDAIDPLTLVVFYGDNVIWTQNINAAGSQTILVPTQHYNFYYYYNNNNNGGQEIDSTHERDENLFFVIHGKITSSIGVPLDNKRVNAYLKGFRSKSIICRAISDRNGYYSMKIAYQSLNNTGLPARNMILEVGTGMTPEAVSQDIFDYPVKQQIDFQLSGYYITEYVDVRYDVNTFVSNINIPSITISGSDRESLYIAKAIDREEDQIICMVRAWYYAYNTQWLWTSYRDKYATFLYAILRSGVPDDPKVIFNLTSEELLNIYNNAKNYVINPDDLYFNYYFLEEMLYVLKDQTDLIEIEGEEMTLSDYYGSTYFSENMDQYFEYLNSYEGDDVGQFWIDFENYYGSSYTEDLQLGLQVASITGFQPQMSNTLWYEANYSWEGLSHSAELSVSDWEDLITGAGGIYAVPKIISDYSMNPITEYAEKLKSLCQNAYPGMALAGHLDGVDGALLIPDTPTRDQVVSFLRSNPEFDMRKDSIYDLEEEETLLELSFVYDVAVVKEALVPFQVLSRITDAKVDAVVELKLAGISSAAAVTSMPEAQFVSEYGAVLGGNNNAQNAYLSAAKINQVSMQSAVQMSAVVNSPNWVWLTASPKPDPIANPDLATLFGNLEQCGCSECMSVYSAGAYYVDVLNFIKKYGTGTNNPWEELIRRRPDLQYIDITCKNANTALPYVDLANEFLEKLIMEHLKPLGQFPYDIPVSYQTVGNATDLAAYPEHVIRLAAAPTETYENFTRFNVIYDDVLPNEFYPLELPFNLPLEEARVYLKHLGYSRLQLMDLFRAYDLSVLSPTDNTWYNYYTESAGMTKYTADIISKGVGGDVYPYYGFDTASGIDFLSPTDSSVIITNSDWDALLRGDVAGANNGGLDILLYILKISYKDLRQLLKTDFLNKPDGGGVEPVKIKGRPGKSDNSCVLRELRLEITGITSTVFFDKLHRFVRLWKGTGLEIYELDILLRAFNVTDITNTGTYPVYQNLMRAIHMARKLNISVEQFTTWWAVMDTHHYINYNSDRQDELPSLYDRLFRSKNVANPPDPAFENTPANPLSGYQYKDHTAIIIAACRISEEDLNLLMSPVALDIPLNSSMSLNGLTRLFATATVCNAMKIKVADFVRFCRLNDIKYGMSLVASTTEHASNQLDQLDKLISRAEALASSGFSLNDISYLLLNKDENELYITEDKVIQPFYEGMRDELKKVYVNTSEMDPVDDEEKIKALKDTLRNIIIQCFAAQTGMEAKTVFYLLDKQFEIGYDPSGGGGYLNKPVLNVLIDGDFIASTYPLSREGIDAVMPPVPPASWPFVNLKDLYPLYIRMRKMALLITRSGIHFNELRLLQEDYVALNVPDLRSYPYTSAVDVADLPFDRLMRYLRWVRCRRQFSITEENFNALVAVTVGGSKEEWVNIIVKITQWTTGQVEELVGNISVPTGGLLGVTYAADFQDPLLLLRMADIITVSAIIGLVPSQIGIVLTSMLQMRHARAVRMAARSKYDETAWLKVAKPLQDPLREKQRNALVAYVLSKPVSSGVTTKKWRTENDLYAWLLIDVEMQPCTMTSRIRLALSSLQLYMSRVIMNLEYNNGNNAQMIQISPVAISQWESWRKWYRIWEANRKVFLYPENWIEPELRDNKTPFFKELETQLLQDELNNDTATDAYMAYLEKLDGIARLEPVTAYHEVEVNAGIDVLHVIARNNEEPAVYYYRKFTDGEWSAWEKMNIEAKSDHLTLIVWNRRLHIFWLTFMEQQFDDPRMSGFLNYLKGNGAIGYVEYWLLSWMRNELNDIGSELRNNTMTMEAAKSMIMKGWNIRLNWSEYKDGKWTPGKSADDVMQMYPWALILTSKALDNLSKSRDTIKDAAGRSKFDELSKFLRKGKDLSVNDLFRNRLYLSPHAGEDGSLVLSVMFPAALDELSIGLHAFKFEYTGAQPYVVRDTGLGFKMMSPHNTVLNKMKFVKTPFKSENWLSVDEYNRQPGQSFFIYPISATSSPNYADHERLSTKLILRNTPFGQYRLTAKANLEPSENVDTNVTRNHFFFDDDRHLFFVRRIESQPSLAQANVIRSVSTISIASSIASYQQNYVNTLITPTPVVSSNTPVSYNTSATLSFSQSPFVYYFQTFYHSHIHNFVKALNKDGIDGLMRLDVQTKTDTMYFQSYYDPSTLVYKKSSGYPYATNIVDFEYDGAYSIYNWELFYHIPMIIAQRLSDNQQFETAQKWFHYIFNPTSNTNDLNQVSGSKQRFWKCRPFYEESGKQILTLQDMMNEINKYGEQVTVWEKKPFSPHVIARMRILAYMKNTVMKYLDNLIAWGDQLFRRDTVESLNEATQLYILASNILGQKPQSIPPKDLPVVQSFINLSGAGLDRFSNAKVKIESLVSTGSFTPGSGSGEVPKMQYFCLPQNDKLMGYWDTVADRLFKIRNCMNIEGVVRQLPLFDPPIDPAMLVRAAASGIDINSVLNEVAGIGMPHYRFSYVLQRANEICADIKGLGSVLLSALEKKDAEELSLIRSGHELKVLESMKSIRESQINDTEQAITVLKKTRESVDVRLKYYSSRPFMIAGEQQHLQALQTAMIMQAIQVGLGATASVLAIIPTAHVQAIASGVSIGGGNFSDAVSVASTALGVGALINNTKGTMAVTKAGYERRRDDWAFQAETAKKDLEQIDQQILGAEIRMDIAEKELENIELQIENSKDVDAYMRSKYTNQELYSWMISQIATTYFQSYQLAFDVAKKAEMCLGKEIPFAKDKMPSAGFIKFGYWDSLRKGLLSGEKLQYDLRKMEVFYMEENKRELEMTKHISLAFLAPDQLLSLKRTGTCSDVALTEALFDLDYPGQYMRRIKSVSISIPCVAGPYTTISCKLSQTSSKYRKTASTALPYNNENNFESAGAGGSIATSSAQNDSGVFELNFRDERYLPFEGSGAISVWTLTMPSEHPLFDYDTIQDVIIHVKYTAQNGTVALEDAANDNLNELFENVGTNFPRIFTLKHDFPDAWSAAFGETVPVPTSPAGLARPLVIPLSRTLYPEYAQRKKIDIGRIEFYLRPGITVSSEVRFYLRINGTGDPLELAPAEYTNGRSLTISIPDNTDIQNLSLAFYKKPAGLPATYVPVEPEDVEDLFMVTKYALSAM